MQSTRITVPAAPAGDAAITLFDSTAFAWGGGQLRAQRAKKLHVVFERTSHASAASGLVASASSNKGVTWDALLFPDSVGTATMPHTVPACTADAERHSFDISDLDDFKVTFTNGADAQTTWRVYCVLECEDGVY